MKHWYLIAYDIREPKRLRKLHYFISKQAFSMQKSVYLIHIEAQDLKQLIKNLKKRVHIHDDDVRLYPVSSPNVIWAAGKQSNSLDGLFSADQNKKKKHSLTKQILSFFGRKQ